MKTNINQRTILYLFIKFIQYIDRWAIFGSSTISAHWKIVSGRRHWHAWRQNGTNIPQTSNYFVFKSRLVRKESFLFWNHTKLRVWSHGHCVTPWETSQVHLGPGPVSVDQPKRCPAGQQSSPRPAGRFPRPSLQGCSPRGRCLVRLVHISIVMLY